MTDKALRHECCENSGKFLRGYPSRTNPGVYGWHLIGVDRYCTHCPWCGGELERARKEATKPTLRAVPDAGE